MSALIVVTISKVLNHVRLSLQYSGTLQNVLRPLSSYPLCQVASREQYLEYLQLHAFHYLKRKDKDIVKLSEYSRKMRINEEVMEYVSMFYE